LSDEALLFRRGFTQDAALLSNPNHAITSAVFYSAFQRGDSTIFDMARDSFRHVPSAEAVC
jgi:hypothetical protein